MSSLEDVLSTSALFFLLPPSETLGFLEFLDSGFSDVCGAEDEALHLQSYPEEELTTHLHLLQYTIQLQVKILNTAHRNHPGHLAISDLNQTHYSSRN